ncbi:hypothetical protein [Falsiroseomonas sp. E2-1-a4]|uniref:hypothetical protein n=1 Tax=Falsiroseomonas sp. E2-1-a4 TaxID=3239299 RepID=UPI003F33D954
MIKGAIRGLLGLPPREHPGEEADLSRIGKPEIYFGATHPTPQDPAQSPRRGDAPYALSAAPALRLNRYALDGTWAREAAALVLRSPRGCPALATAWVRTTRQLVGVRTPRRAIQTPRPAQTDAVTANSVIIPEARCGM